MIVDESDHADRPWIPSACTWNAYKVPGTRLSMGIGFRMLATFNTVQADVVAAGAAPAVAPAEAGVKLGVEVAEARGAGGIAPKRRL